MPLIERASDAAIAPPATSIFAVELTPIQMTDRYTEIIEIKFDHKLFYFE
jgi:hypothetical protein